MRKEYFTFPSHIVWIDRDEILGKVTKEKEDLVFSLKGMPLDASIRAYIKGKIDSLKWVENQLINYGKVSEE